VTPAITAARRARITFAVHEYEHDANARSFGLEAAEKLGLDAARVFKTLIVALDGGSLAVGIVPASAQLDMKQVPREAAERATGYVMGGISPLGQKKRLPMALDESALGFPTIYVSGGRRGLDLELAPADLVTLTGAVSAALATR
jgi:Cys-tRNA(Pro)/Cys-tRNA(Cys) deacylase